MKMSMFFVALPMASAAFGKDTYAMSHPFAWKEFMEEYFPTAENLVVSNNTDTCVEWVKLCIDDGHMTACSGPQGNFQMHAVGAYERDSGAKSMEQLETEFTQSMGDMSQYSPFFDYNMALLTTDLDYYITAFDNGGIPYFASTFVDEVTDAKYNSVLVQTPGSLASGSSSMVNIELLASSSSLLEARSELHQHAVPRASSTALEGARAHLAAAPRSLSGDGKPVVAKVHRSFASSDTSRDVTYFKDVLQGEMTCSGNVCSGKMLSSDVVEFRYAQATSDFQGPMSVAEWESYQVSLHNTCFDSPNNDGFDRLADNHWGHELGRGAALDKYINGQKAAGLPYRFYGGLGHGVQFLYIYGPNGWGCQVIGTCTDSSLCPSGTGGYDMCTQGIKGHCSKDGSSDLAV
jgi:hypothetical protein